LLPGLGGEVAVEKPVLAMEAKKNASLSPITQATITMIRGNYKLIWYIDYAGYDDVYELYDLEKDLEELLDLGKSHSDILLSMSKELKNRLADADRPYNVSV
jgi:hypothetical protein